MTWLGYLGLIPFGLFIATFTPDATLICLMAWLVIVITPEQFRLGIVVALAGYICVWLIERIKLNALGNEFPRAYQRLRSHLTIGVGVAHIVAFAGVI
jgi:hypothetical protein